MSDGRCVAEVTEAWGFYNHHTCNRPAKGRRNGYAVCGIHLRSKNFRARLPDRTTQPATINREGETG